MMKTTNHRINSFPRQLALLLLASAIAIPAMSQDQPASGNTQSTPSATADQPPSATADQQSMPELTPPPPAKEGFWGRVNPFARKKWVQKRIDPINDSLSELDQVNAKNARDIKDVDSRAQAGIAHAQSTADAANQQAQQAGTAAQAAGNTAEQASTHVGQLNDTVNGLDQYKKVSEVEVKFRAGSPALTDDARKQLDDLATGLAGQKGYILDIEAHAPGAGSVGIASSQRLAESVERYMVTAHQIPVYRMHSAALGNAQMASDSDSGDQAGQTAQAPAAKVRTSSVDIRVMENSLAAQAGTPPQGAPASTGMEQQ